VAPLPQVRVDAHNRFGVRRQTHHEVCLVRVRARNLKGRETMGRVLTQGEVEDVRRALEGKNGGRSMSRPDTVIRDLLASLDAARQNALTEACIALYEQSPHNADEAIDIVKRL
jgi:hypothetical protein